MANLVRIKTNDSLVRDLNSGAVINTNRTEYENYLARRKKNTDVSAQLKKNCDEISEIKNELSEVKELLLAMLKQGNN